MSNSRRDDRGNGRKILAGDTVISGHTQMSRGLRQKLQESPQGNQSART